MVVPIARPYRWPRFPLKRHRFQCSRRARTLLSVVGTRAAYRGNAAPRPSTCFSPLTEPHPERPITAPQPRVLNPYRLERSSPPTGSRIDPAVTAVAMTTVNTVAVTLAILITAVLAHSAIMASNPSAASVSRPSTEYIPANATPSSEQTTTPNSSISTTPPHLLGPSNSEEQRTRHCTTRRARTPPVAVFECHGLTPDNQQDVEDITVSTNGASWESN